MGNFLSTVISAILPHIPTLIELFKIMPAKPAPMPEVPGKTKEQLREDARKELGIDSINQYNFAFCGVSGVGKSTLINVIQGLKDTDPGAARIGVTETSQSVARNHVPGFPHLVLWDVPGAGTQAHTAKTYFMDNKLYAFDFLLIITGTRVTEIDIILAENALEAGVPVAFVRSKTDVDLTNLSEEKGIPISECKGDYHWDLSRDIRGQLPEGVQHQRLFLVSAKVFRFPKYAEMKLDEDRLLEWVFHVAQKRK